MKMRFVTEDGEASAWQTITDLSCVDLKQQTPASVYGGQTAGYCNKPITGTITVTLPDGSGYSTDLPFGDVYIALKGDVNFSGETNASDAAKVLIYAADVGAGQTPDLYSSDKNDETLEQLARCLADVNEDGLINASDAALILIYAAEQGAGNQPDWDAILKRTNGKS